MTGRTLALHFPPAKGLGKGDSPPPKTYPLSGGPLGGPPPTTLLGPAGCRCPPSTRRSCAIESSESGSNGGCTHRLQIPSSSSTAFSSAEVSVLRRGGNCLMILMSAKAFSRASAILPLLPKRVDLAVLLGEAGGRAHRAALHAERQVRQVIAAAGAEHLERFAVQHRNAGHLVRS